MNRTILRLRNQIYNNEIDEFAITLKLNPSININAQFHDLDTLLHVAARHGRFECVIMLVNRKIDIHVLNDNLNDALLVATLWYSWCVDDRLLKEYYEIIKFLVGCGAKCNLVNSFGITALMYICDYTDNHDFNDIKGLVALLSKYGPDCKGVINKKYTLAQYMQTDNRETLVNVIQGRF